MGVLVETSIAQNQARSPHSYPPPTTVRNYKTTALDALIPHDLQTQPTKSNEETEEFILVDKPNTNIPVNNPQSDVRGEFHTPHKTLILIMCILIAIIFLALGIIIARPCVSTVPYAPEKDSFQWLYDLTNEETQNYINHLLECLIKKTSTSGFINTYVENYQTSTNTDGVNTIQTLLDKTFTNDTNLELNNFTQWNITINPPALPPALPPTNQTDETLMDILPTEKPAEIIPQTSISLGCMGKLLGYNVLYLLVKTMNRIYKSDEQKELADYLFNIMEVKNNEIIFHEIHALDQVRRLNNPMKTKFVAVYTKAIYDAMNNILVDISNKYQTKEPISISDFCSMLMYEMMHSQRKLVGAKRLDDFKYNLILNDMKKALPTTITIEN